MKPEDIIKHLLIFTFVSVAFLTGGCLTTSTYTEKVPAYRPEVGNRYLGKSESTGFTPASTATPVAAEPSEPDDSGVMLKRGDQITINIYGTGEKTAIEDVIDATGSVNLPYIGSVKIGGKTTSEAELHIEESYVAGKIYKQIQVSVVKAFDGEFYVHGEVNNKQGVYPLAGDTTILDAIARAGGFTVFAKQTKVKLIRDNDVTLYDVKKMMDGELDSAPIKPGDMIVVDKTRW
ncbi:hypothetical protein BVX97_03155 [bacterium E08(2017)]|nr:hypothetical protein BVX97_03155 [bacterium E08(2017)]